MTRASQVVNLESVNGRSDRVASDMEACPMAATITSDTLTHPEQPTAYTDPSVFQCSGSDVRPAHADASEASISLSKRRAAGMLAYREVLQGNAGTVWVLSGIPPDPDLLCASAAWACPPRSYGYLVAQPVGV